MEKTNSKDQEIRRQVQEGYGKVAERGGGCCGFTKDDTVRSAKECGYEDSDLQGVAGEANMGLGCGNPTAFASLKEGEVVVDLGSGAGLDALVAAPKLGESGRFIGVDMTPEMLGRARENAVKAGFAKTVEFREGLIEDLPVASSSVDVVISNCVVNLSPDKKKVFEEVFRVTKPGGRIAISDVVLTEPLPESLRENGDAWLGCVAGALTESEYLGHIESAGFVDVSFERTPAGSLLESCLNDPEVERTKQALGASQFQAAVESVFSYSIRARRP